MTVAVEQRARGALAQRFDAAAPFGKAHARLLLGLLAIVPFLSSALAFLRGGVPDVLFAGDAATLELRVWHASHGVQLLGPYSRFLWSHPGPAYFYLALPFYQLFHEHGPALNVFALVSNAAAALTLVLMARRLRGDLFALAVVVLLGVYELHGIPFSLTNEWNPSLPVLPLALLFFLGARIATSSLAALPAFVFVASAVIQTHVGLLAAALSLASLTALFCVRRWVTSERGHRESPRIAIRAGVSAVLVLAVMWALPVYENFTTEPGNLRRLFEFFTDPHRPSHTFTLATELVAQGAAVMPLALVRVFHPGAGSPTLPAALVLGAVQVVGLLALLGYALATGDNVLALLATFSVGLFAVAISAVRAIRDQVQTYLLYWVTLLGLFCAIALAAFLVARLRRAKGPHVTAAVLGLAALILLGPSVAYRAGGAVVHRPPNPVIDKLAADVETAVRTRPEATPVISVATPDAWEGAFAVALSLRKHRVPIFVERHFLFMVGRQFDPGTRERPRLLIGEQPLAEASRHAANRRLVSASGNLYAYWEDSGYFREHRLADPPQLVGVVNVDESAGRAVDGVWPGEGTPWDSAQTLVLPDTTSALEVAVPPGDLSGVLMVVDGNDDYGATCVPAHGPRFALGETQGLPQSGMWTRVVWSTELGRCRTVVISPVRGDRSYSIGEVGFLRR